MEKKCAEIYRHYGIEKDRKDVKDGKIKEIDFLIGKEEDIEFLTNSMAGFGTEQSQRVIIEYDKGYGYFIVKRLRMEYGVSKDTPKKSGFFQMFFDRAKFIFAYCRIVTARPINRFCSFIRDRRKKANRKEKQRMEKTDNWIMFNLPENCTSISVSFKREIAEMQVEKFGATPLYGLDGKKEEQLPVEIFITYGGTLAPNQRCRFDSMRQDNEAEEKLKWLKSIGAAEFQEPIRYIYTFPDYNGAFNLSERYIAETTLEELKAQYEKNKTYVQEIIRSKKSRDNFLRGAEPL